MHGAIHQNYSIQRHKCIVITYHPIKHQHQPLIRWNVIKTKRFDVVLYVCKLTCRKMFWENVIYDQLEAVYISSSYPVLDLQCGWLSLLIFFLDLQLHVDFWHLSADKWSKSEKFKTFNEHYLIYPLYIWNCY